MDPIQPTPAQMLLVRHLKYAGPSDAKEIASSLKVTPMAVRHHLAVLEKAGFLSTTLERRRTGRPTHLYALTDRAEALFPNEYVDFMKRLIEAIVQMDGEAKVAEIFNRMREAARAQHAPRMGGKSFEERVAEMAKIQSESGYMADWRQTGPRTFELTEHNCALLGVARSWPQCCDCELATMQELLGAAINRKEHIATGDSVCRYVIQPSPSRLPRAAGGIARGTRREAS